MGKITQEELDSINEVKKEAIQTVYVLGEFEYQKMVIDINLEEVRNKVKDLRKREAKILEGLKTKYGSVNINIETGEFE